ncbi:MAG: prolipoprotein diacylglyceryl transferase [Rickettsiaceae bacterium]|nr:prolipoprotein diacylglyceryl transferase [Rickettsiaceae bacterium]
MSFPDIDPYIIRFYGKIGITWYSLSYVTGILAGWKYALFLLKKTGSKIKPTDFDDYITWLIMGVILGGRLGYVLLYEPYRYLSNPIDILKTYEGGMSFHGGIIGVALSIIIFCKFRKIRILELSDILVQCAPIGICLGRISNFINGELYGSTTDLPWGVVFPNAGPIPRHPSQIYESFTEGFLLFIVLFYYSLYLKLYKKIGALTGIFLVGYSVARSFCEVFRLPDFTILSITSGQLYSLPMFILGIYLIYGLKRKNS